MSSEGDDDPSDGEDEPQPGEVWLALVEGKYQDKDRPVVVVMAHDERIEVVYGGSKRPPHPDFVLVKVSSKAAGYMGLTTDTYFRFTNVAFVERSCFVRRLGSCPRSVAAKLAALVHNYHLNYGEQDGDDEPGS